VSKNIDIKFQKFNTEIHSKTMSESSSSDEQLPAPSPKESTQAAEQKQEPTQLRCIEKVTGYAWRGEVDPDVEFDMSAIWLYGEEKGGQKMTWMDERWHCTRNIWPQDMLDRYFDFREHNPLPTHEWPMYPSDSDELPVTPIERPKPCDMKAEQKGNGIINQVKINYTLHFLYSIV
jgi:hypothetical protein